MRIARFPVGIVLLGILKMRMTNNVKQTGMDMLLWLSRATATGERKVR